MIDKKPDFYILQQRQATKNMSLKRLKYIGIDKAIKQIKNLIIKFPKNQEYYISLIKGLRKLDVKSITH